MKRKVLLFILLTFSIFLNNHAMTTEDITPTILLKEDFNAFTEGTENIPATTDISSYSSGKLSKTLSGWNGKYVYEAGGMLKISDKGNLQTAKYDMSTNGGIIKVTFKVKSLESYGGIIKCAIGYNTAEQVMLTDGEWHTVSIIMEKGTSTSYLKFEPYLISNGFLIDDLTIETSPLFFKSPKANQPTIANESYFYATWSKVTGAANYLLDVYSKKGDETKEFLLENEKVSTNLFKVEGLQVGKVYYYTVRAQKGEAISDPSNEIEVVEVITNFPAPSVSQASNITSEGFTANWQQSEKAVTYTVRLSKEETLAEDKEVTRLFEDFSGIKQGTLNFPIIGDVLEEYLDSYTTVPGWYAILDCYANGYIGLSPYSSNATLTTPALDLTHNNGIFSATFKMSENLFGQDKEGAIINITLYNGEDIAEQKSVTLNKGFANYSVNFTKGAKESYIEIAYNGANKLFIDEVTVKQQMKAGDKFTSIISSQKTENTHYDFTVEALPAVTYLYDVQAFVRTVIGDEIDLLGSPFSEVVRVSLPTSIIDKYAFKQASVYIKNGILTVNLPTAGQIEVYSLNGQMTELQNGQAGENIIVLSKGAYIIRVGNKAFKVIL